MSLWEFLFYSGIHAYEGCYSFHAQSGEEAYNMAILMANIVEKLRNFDSCYCCLSPDNTAASSSLAYQSVNLRIFL